MKQGVSDGRVTVLLARVSSPADESKCRELGVIVLVGVENVDEDWWRAVCYVGMSRARTHLYVILSANCEGIRKQRWEAQLESAYEGKW